MTILQVVHKYLHNPRVFTIHGVIADIFFANSSSIMYSFVLSSYIKNKQNNNYAHRYNIKGTRSPGR